jgi:small subunit ribosomal protein S20
LANTKSALKDIRVSRTRQKRNKVVRSATKSVVRRAREAIAGDDKEAAVVALRAAESQLDRAADKGILHPNTVARRKSRLAKKLNKVNTPEIA